jgi:hypothetical protein
VILAAPEVAMRRALLVSALGCLVTAATLHAQPHPGVALRWNHCFGEGTGILVRSFACDTNAGLEELVGSFALYEDMPEVSGLEILVDVSTGNPYYPPAGPLPEWWKFVRAGTCRQNALSFSTVANPGDQVCVDWASGQAVGALGDYVIDFRGEGTARIRAVAAVPSASLGALYPGTEYYAFALRIRHDKTVGTGACAGCDVPLWIVFNSINVVTPLLANNRTLTGPLNGVDSDIAIWAQAKVPTRTESWSAIKARFR